MKYTRKVVRAVFAFAIFAAMASSSYAQFTVHLLLNPPVSPYLSDWKSRASTASFLVTNSGPSRQCKILAELYINGAEVAFTKPDKIIPRIVPSGATTYNGESLVPMMAVHFENNVDQSSQRAGRIPDGELCIIAILIDAQTGAELARDRACSLILSYSPPQLILPEDHSELCRPGYHNVITKRDGQPMPVFQWTPIVPAAQTPVTYHFAIFEVLKGQAPIAAIRGARPLFARDIPNLTNLVWPIEYFLPEKGKMYTWSVRALDVNGNPFVLTNDGWAEPFVFNVLPTCDQSGTGGSSTIANMNFLPPIIDFGSQRVNTQSIGNAIQLTNTGTENINLHTPVISDGADQGFFISHLPVAMTLVPGMSTSFAVSFKPVQTGRAEGSVSISSDNGTLTIPLSGQGIDNLAPTMNIISPVAGDKLSSGTPFTIQFHSSDNDALSDYVIGYSTDGGVTFSGTINSSVTPGSPSSLIWNIPVDLQTSQAVIKISARDKSGDIISALSGLFSVGNGIGTGSNDRSYVGGYFALKLDGSDCGMIQKLDGGDISIASNDNTPQEISLHLTPECDAINQWIEASLSMKYIRKSGAINAADFNRDVRQTRQFMDALITEISFPSCDGASKDPAYLGLKFTPEKIINKKDSGKLGEAINGKQKMWFPANFRLKIDGLDEACSRVNKVEAIVIKQSTVKDDVGQLRDAQKEPGKLEYPNLVIFLPDSDVIPFKNWYNKVTINGNNGKGTQKNGSLTYYDNNHDALCTLTFHNLGIFKISSDGSEASEDRPKNMKIEMTIEKLDAKLTANHPSQQ